MRRHIFAAGIAAAALIPTLAMAQSYPSQSSPSQASCERQRTKQVIGTVAGAGVGGVLGNVIAGQGDKTLGTVIGAVGGAVIGNQVTKPSRDCRNAYGYYDENNRWHATGVSTSDARGYYDRNGDWIEGAPNGRYGDDNRWIPNSGSNRGEGTYDAQRGWIPASANGYYDRNDQWVSGSATGYYDANGRWVSGANSQPDRRADAYGYYDAQGMWHANSLDQGRATGYYDRDNKWVSGTPNGHYDERHNWVPHRNDGSSSGSYDAQNRWIPSSSNGYYDYNGQWTAGTTSGYYDTRGRWVAGLTTGHYDAQGRWVAGTASGHRDANGVWIADPQPGYYDSNGRWHAGESYGYYDSRGRWISTRDHNSQAMPRGEILTQLNWLDSYLRNATAQRSLNRGQLISARREVSSIRSRERYMRHDRMGNLSARDEATLQLRIDRLTNRLRINRNY